MIVLFRQQNDRTCKLKQQRRGETFVEKGTCVPQLPVDDVPLMIAVAVSCGPNQ